ncbi:cyclopropane-fatty-acyl-phospholipid synthase family protein [Pinirhizobacter sp.]|jgi:cyclopropane-fatty-acyl-phospholipid synthase|uniref:SAM-dependent methyltransferase n=1 Tax=Pinirhizobacter sp. TaxID=2950432 RepID=UPI002F3F2391
MNTATLDLGPATPNRPATGLLGLAERGLVPDAMLRRAIRHLCAKRLAEESAGGPGRQAERFGRLIDELKQSAVAIHTDAANRQHYELPPRFFELCLGPNLKYSSCIYRTDNQTLGEAEEAMLALTAERAGLSNNQDILELGCGWGSLTMWMARHFPESRITAVSNSNSQREYIQARCRERGLNNVRVITHDVQALALPSGSFDRCVSVEMFEHMRNYDALMSRIAGWLRADGSLFVHIFAHRFLMYPFQTTGQDDWMGRHFFTGGLMPSVDTLLWFDRDLCVADRWLVDGTHYQRTADAWLGRQDANKDEVMQVLEEAYGPAAPLWFQRWRMFWMACAELFGFDGGQAWMVAHYRFVRRRTTA